MECRFTGVIEDGMSLSWQRRTAESGCVDASRDAMEIVDDLKSGDVTYETHKVTLMMDSADRPFSSFLGLNKQGY